MKRKITSKSCYGNLIETECLPAWSSKVDNASEGDEPVLVGSSALTEL